MSIAAVEQLPPFANMARNITWVDDGIKRALHEGLGDLTSGDTSRLENASLRQERLGDQNGIMLRDVKWAIDKYMPRLISGILMNCLMYDVEAQRPGVFSESLQLYMLERRRPNEVDFKEWSNVCNQTIRKMRRIWSRDNYDHPAGEIFMSYCDETLCFDEPYFDELVNSFVYEKEIPDVFEFFRVKRIDWNTKIVNGKSTAVHVAQTLGDLRRYIDLMEFWPYLCRTMEFMMRRPGTALSDLGRE